MYDKIGEVKLIDFGLAKQTSTGQKLHTIAGTPYYIGPEVLAGNYGRECDIWSLGVLLFVLVTGTYPFDSVTKNRAEVFQKIQKGHYTFPEAVDKTLSHECKDLIKRMITVERNKRITGEQALGHEWFTKFIKR